MSQTMPEMPQRKRAINYAAEDVKNFRAETARLNEERNQSVPPSPPPQMDNVQYIPPADMPPLPNYLTTPPQQQQQQSQPDYASVEKQYKDEIESLKAQLEQARAEAAQARQIPDDLRALQDEQELDKMLADHAQEFSSISLEDAKRFMLPIMKSMRQQYAASEARAKTYEDQINQRFAEYDKREQARILTNVREKLLKAHPDLETLQKTDAYKRIMLTPVGGNSGILTGQLVAAEYQRGNADYVISVLNEVKKSITPDLSNIASVSATNTGSSVPPAPTGDGFLTDDQLAELRYKRQTGSISSAQYREAMKKHREARGKI